MSRLFPTILLLVAVALRPGIVASAWAQTSMPQASPTLEPLAPEDDLLEAEPIDTLLRPAPAPPPSPTPAPAAETATSAPGGETAPAASGGALPPVHKERPQNPYYFSAYIPAVDRTEVDLGFFLSRTPGIEVALGWGAMEELMISARMSAFGASSTVGLGLRYLLLPENPASSKPALSLLLRGLFLNHRTLGEIRENIFRGNRVRLGLTLSKDFGALGRSLEVTGTLLSLLEAIRLHAEAAGEFQTGRLGADERALSRGEFGARAALEIVPDPERLYVYLLWDSLPDWLDEQNYYLGIRYFTRPDLAFDLLGGFLQNDYGVILSLAWIF